MRIFALLVGAAALLCGAAHAQQPSALIETVPVRVDSSRDAIGRVTTPVYINGHGPFNFVVDTGANRSVISRRIADSIGLQITGMGQVHAFTGVFDAPLARVGSLRSGAASLSDVHMPVVDGPMLANADGLLGVEALAERRLIMNMRERAISVDDGMGELDGWGWIRLPGQIRFGNLIVTQGRIGRIRVNVILDTGAQTSVVNMSLRNELTAGRGDARAVTGTRITSIADPIILDEAVYIPRLNFAEGGIGNITAYAGNLYIFELWGLQEEPTIVIGMDVLAHLPAIALNYRRSRIEFRINRMSPPPGALVVAPPPANNPMTPRGR